MHLTSEPKMTEICRLCAKYINGISLSMTADECRARMASIIPELDPYVVNTPVMCTHCSKSLADAYKFKQNCLETDKQLRTLINQPNDIVQDDTTSSVMIKSQIVYIDETIGKVVDDDSGISDSLNRAKPISKISLKRKLGKRRISMFWDQQLFEMELAELVGNHKTLTCNFCDYSAPKKEMLRSHLKLHVNYQCKHCHNFSGSKVQVTKHGREVHKDLVMIKCNICRLRFENREELTTHVNQSKCAWKLSLCTVCGKRIRSDGMRRHMRRHTGEKPYSCKFCLKRFADAGSIKLHVEICPKNVKYASTEDVKSEKKIKLKTGVTSVFWDQHLFETELTELIKNHYTKKCNICKYEAPSVDMLQLHLKVHIRYQCKYCNASFQTSGGVGNHFRRSHKDVKLIRCTICKRYFNEQNELEAHMDRAHSDVNLQACVVCGKKITLYGLKMHMRLHSGDKPYSCHICSKRFYQSGHVYIHLRTCTKGKTDKITKSPDSKPNMVSTSENTKPHDLKTVVKSRSAVSIFWDQELFEAVLTKLVDDHVTPTCKICNHKTLTVGDLSSHLKDHIHRRCRYCDASFETNHEVVEHVKMCHKDINVCKCPVCRRFFGSKDKLEWHMWRVHSHNNLRACSVCGKNIATYRLKRHMRLHAVELPHPCKKCGKKFEHLISVRRHMQSCAKKERAAEQTEHVVDENKCYSVAKVDDNWTNI